MATKFTLTHEINCNLDTFWKVFLDRDFNTQLYTVTLGFPEWTILEQTDNDTGANRKVTALPKMEVPGPVQKLLGSNFRYVEEGSMSKPERIWRWKMTPSTLAEKLITSGAVRAEAIGSDKTRRFADMSIEAKIFGLGGLIEGSAEKQMRDGWDKSAVFMNKFIAAAGAGAGK